MLFICKSGFDKIFDLNVACPNHGALARRLFIDQRSQI